MKNLSIRFLIVSQRFLFVFGSTSHHVAVEAGLTNDQSSVIGICGILLARGT